jgi:hypothetical protein
MSKEKSSSYPVDKGESKDNKTSQSSIVRVNEVTMYDFEIKMRKMIIDLLNPSIEKMSKDRETQANMIRS